MPSARPQTPQMVGIHLLLMGLLLTMSPTSRQMTVMAATPVMPIALISIVFYPFLSGRSSTSAMIVLRCPFPPSALYARCISSKASLSDRRMDPAAIYDWPR